MRELAGGRECHHSPSTTFYEVIGASVGASVAFACARAAVAAHPHGLLRSAGFVGAQAEVDAEAERREIERDVGRWQALACVRAEDTYSCIAAMFLQIMHCVTCAVAASRYVRHGAVPLSRIHDFLEP